MFMHKIVIKQAPGAGPRRKLLLIPGFAGASSSYFAMFKPLSEHFEITAFDMLGFACSGRPELLTYDYEETIELLVLQMRVFLDTIGYENDKQSYSIAAHSMGCLIASHFTKRYPKYVD